MNIECIERISSLRISEEKPRVNLGFDGRIILKYIFTFECVDLVYLVEEDSVQVFYSNGYEFQVPLCG
jgi:hypothetical protein